MRLVVVYAHAIGIGALPWSADECAADLWEFCRAGALAHARGRAEPVESGRERRHLRCGPERWARRRTSGAPRGVARRRALDGWSRGVHESEPEVMMALAVLAAAPTCAGRHQHPAAPVDARHRRQADRRPRQRHRRPGRARGRDRRRVPGGVPRLSGPDRGAGPRTDEAIPLLRRLWTGEPVTHDGRFYAMDDVRIHPAPAVPGGPPIVVAGRQRPAMRRAAHLGDGWMPYLYSPRRYAESVAVIRDHAERVGRSLDRFAWCAFVFVGLHADGEQARADAARFLGGRTARTSGRWSSTWPRWATSPRWPRRCSSSSTRGRAT